MQMFCVNRGVDTYDKERYDTPKYAFCVIPYDHAWGTEVHELLMAIISDKDRTKLWQKIVKEFDVTTFKITSYYSEMCEIL